MDIVLQLVEFCLALRCREMTETPKKVPGADIIEGLLPPEMALACEAAGVTKAGRDVLALVILGLLAGAFIAFGAIFMTVVDRSRRTPLGRCAPPGWYGLFARTYIGDCGRRRTIHR